MIATREPPFAPVELFSGIDRLDSIATAGPTRDAPVAAPTPVDWKHVHQVVQDILRNVSDRVLNNEPAIRSRPGGTRGDSFFLYSYRVFDLGDSEDVDPVVVSLGFSPAPIAGRVLVRAEIGGEGTGRIDFEAEEMEVPSDHAAVLAAACQAASVLAAKSSLVIQAVLARHAPPVY
jgi:hypothetical protein